MLFSLSIEEFKSPVLVGMSTNLIGIGPLFCIEVRFVPLITNFNRAILILYQATSCWLYFIRLIFDFLLILRNNFVLRFYFALFPSLADIS